MVNLNMESLIDHLKYNMARGSDIYMFKHASSMQKAAAFKYIKFLTSKSSQLKWANATGRYSCK